jgi:predicted AlkP superfamily phosphohydrolase/phosphomutase
MTSTLLIGLDGATFDILDPLVADGVMPRLGELLDGGTRARLISTVNPLTAQAWPSLMTGRSPGHHGLLDFVRLEAGGVGPRFQVTSSRDLACPTIWQMVSAAGQRVTVLNFFGLYPPLPIAGHSIAAFIPWRHLKHAVYPPELYQELLALPGFDRRELAMDLDLEKKCIQGMPPEDYEPWILLHHRREEQWARILFHLMRTDPSDLTAIVFDGVDKLQHACWRMIDPCCLPADPSAWEQHIRGLCLDYFAMLDRHIADAVDFAGADARVLIVSDHGFGPTEEVFYVNVWLAQRGHLRWRDGSGQDRDGWLTPHRLKSQVELIDWHSTRAFAATPSSNGIMIATSDDGVGPGVAPEEYEAFRAHLRAELLAYRDPTGRPVVTAVRTREEAYPGAAAGRAPDLVLTLRDSGFVSIMNADSALAPRSEVCGTHRPEGIFVACGPGIPAGCELDDLSILDVAPLVLAWHGIQAPPELEGRAPLALSSTTVSDVVGDSLVAVAAGAPGPDRDGDPDADEAVLARLRSLGYIE